MKEQSAYEKSREMLLSAYKSLSEEKQEHAQTCHTCNGSGFDPLTPANQFKICDTCKGSTSVIVMR
jgi:DnaJ-class molecular chaperone